MNINPNCHIISVLGGKGGMGKSVFAANLALSFLIELKGRVLLIDLDAGSCGDQTAILGIRPSKTISEAAIFSGTINTQSISTIVAQHNSGLHYIGAVRNPGESYDVNVDGLKRLLGGLSNLYSHIIVDLGSQLFAPQLAVMELSSCGLLVTTPDILAINQTNKLTSNLMTMLFPNDMLQVVLNRVSNNPALSPQIASQSLRKNFIGIIPQDDVTVNNSLAKSVPYAVGAPRSPVAVATHEVVRRLEQGNLLEKLRTLNKPKSVQSTEKQVTQLKAFGAASMTETRPNDGKKSDSFDLRTALKQRLLKGLLDSADLEKGATETKGDPAKESELRLKCQQIVINLLDKEKTTLAREERQLIVKEVLDEALGLGPLEDFLADVAVSEIMVNRRDMIYVEKNGRLERQPISFTSEDQLKKIIERIVTPLGRIINSKTPYVDARLKDGSRVNAVIPPLALDGSVITIRKFAKKPITAKDYVGFGTLNENMINFLRICVENRLNVIISGGTGSGKTTLLNVLSGYIPAYERIITIEDAAELQLKQEHVVRLETKPPNIEGEGAVDIRQLLKNSLRMRPDRIVVGECRGGEALDMLSAMNTGHEGSLTTVHANSPREAISRIETLCLMAGMDLPVKAIREQIASAVDLIIQISRLSDGSRKVIDITEVVGMQGEVISLAQVFRFKEGPPDKNRKVTGVFQPTGTIPRCLEEFEKKGVNVPRSLFAMSDSSGPELKPTGTTGGPKKS